MKVNVTFCAAILLAVLCRPVHALGSKVEDGSSVRLSYSFEANGIAVVPREKKADILLVIGEGAYPAAFERQLIGLKEGDQKNIVLTPDQAYGPYQAELLKRVPKNQLPPKLELKEGALLGGKTGQQVMRVAKVLDDSVILDQNHPLAGKTLAYHVQVTNVD